ncbi:hypothetical protein CerSpe_140370 [Prunus speciosa]
MEPSLNKAARSGDVGFLSKNKDADVPDDLLHQKTPMDNNILHIAAEFKHIDFFKQIPPQSPLFWTPPTTRVKLPSTLLLELVVMKELSSSSTMRKNYALMMRRANPLLIQ